jgi:hypothetical protein
MNNKLTRDSDPMRRASRANNSTAFPVLSDQTLIRLIRCVPSPLVNTYLQWCFRVQNVNCVIQTGQLTASASGCHIGSIISGWLADDVEGAELGVWVGVSVVRSIGFRLELPRCIDSEDMVVVDEA